MNHTMPFLCAQVMGVDDAIKAAAGEGWVEVTLVVITLAAFTLLGWMIKHLTTRHSSIEERMQADAIARETRLATRIDTLQDTVRSELMTLVRENSTIMGKMITASDAIVEAAQKMTATVERFTVLIDSGTCPLSPLVTEKAKTGKANMS